MTTQLLHQEPHPLANPERLLDTKAAAAFLGISWLTLNDWRVRGIGPVFLKVGRLVKYRRSDLDAWLNSRTAQNTAQAEALEA